VPRYTVIVEASEGLTRDVYLFVDGKELPASWHPSSEGKESFDFYNFDWDEIVEGMDDEPEDAIESWRVALDGLKGHAADYFREQLTEQEQEIEVSKQAAARELERTREAKIEEAKKLLAEAGVAYVPGGVIGDTGL